MMEAFVLFGYFTLSELSGPYLSHVFDDLEKIIPHRQFLKRNEDCKSFTDRRIATTRKEMPGSIADRRYLRFK